MFSEPIDLEAWWAIFQVTKLSELRKHCRSVTLHGSDLAKLIWAAKYPIPLCHLPVFKHHHPEHLILSDADRSALGSSEVGQPFSDAARKTVRKVSQMFQERRMFCGHLFWLVEDPETLPSAWQFFYFDQNDTDGRRPHWKHGSHIHLMNHLTHPRLPVEEFLDKLRAEDRPKLSGGLHIRFSR